MSSKQGTQIETDIWGWTFHEIVQEQNRFHQLEQYSCKCIVPFHKHINEADVAVIMNVCIVPFHRHVNRTLNVLRFKNKQQKIQHTKFNMIEHDNDLKFSLRQTQTDN